MKKIATLVMTLISVLLFTVAVSDETPTKTKLQLTLEQSYVWSVPSSVVTMYENPTGNQNQVTISLQEVKRYGDEYTVTITAQNATLNEVGGNNRVEVKLDKSLLTFTAIGTQTGTLTFVDSEAVKAMPAGTYTGTMTFTSSINY